MSVLPQIIKHVQKYNSLTGLEKKNMIISMLKHIVDITDGFESRGLQLKPWIKIFDDVPPMKYLSYLYHPRTDELGARLCVNWSRIRRGARTGPPLLLDGRTVSSVPFVAGIR